MNTSIAQATGLRKLNPCTSGWTRNTGGELLWFNGQQFPDELMKPTNRKTPKRQNTICNKQTNKHHHYHYQPHRHKHCAHKNLQHFFQNIRCEMVQNRIAINSQATKDMNPTLTLLIGTAIVVTVTMKYIPDQPKH